MEVVYNVKVDTKDAVKESDKLVKSLDDIVDELKNVDKAIDKTNTENLEDSLKDLNNLVQSGTLNFEDYSKVLEQYTDIALKAGSTSPIGQEAIQNASNLKQEYQSVETAIDALAQKGSNLQATLQLGETVVAGYQAFIGIQALVGDENEELIEVLTKLQAVQGVAQSLQTVRNALDKESLLLIKGKALAEKLFGSVLKKNVVATTASAAASTAQGAATSGAAAAQTALNIAMNANPIFLIITAIVALVSALVIFIATSNEAADAQEDYNNAVADSSEEIEKLNALLARRTSLINEDIKNTNKVIDLEIKYLEAIKNRSDEQEAALQAKYGERQANEVKIFANEIDKTNRQTQAFFKNIPEQFEAIGNSISALDAEDVIDNNNYDLARQKVSDLRKEFGKLNVALGTGDPEKYNLALRNLEGSFKDTQKTLNSFKRRLEDDEELEIIQGTIDLTKGLGDTIKEISASADQYNTLRKDKDVLIETQKQEAALQKLKEQQEAAEQAARRRREREAELARERERLANLQIQYEQRNQDIQIALIEDSYERELATLKLKLERETAAIEGSTKEANDLREALELQFNAKLKAIDEKRAAERLASETAFLDRIKAVKDSYAEEESSEDILLNLKIQQESELALFREGLENELITIQEFDELKLQQQKAYSDAILAIDEEEKAKLKQNDDDQRNSILTNINASLDSATKTAESLISLNDLVTSVQIKNAQGNEKEQERIRKESFERNKKLQIAMAVISGVQGVINALTAQSVIPEPFGTILKVASAVAIGAATAANIAKISSAKYGGGSSGGAPSIPSASVGAGASASQISGRDLSDIRTDLSDDNTSDEQNPIQVVVLESDITKTQETVTQIGQKTTF